MKKSELVVGAEVVWQKSVTGYGIGDRVVILDNKLWKHNRNYRSPQGKEYELATSSDVVGLYVWAIGVPVLELKRDAPLPTPEQLQALLAGDWVLFKDAWFRIVPLNQLKGPWADAVKAEKADQENNERLRQVAIKRHANNQERLERVKDGIKPLKGLGQVYTRIQEGSDFRISDDPSVTIPLAVLEAMLDEIDSSH